MALNSTWLSTSQNQSQASASTCLRFAPRHYQVPQLAVGCWRGSHTCSMTGLCQSYLWNICQDNIGHAIASFSQSQMGSNLVWGVSTLWFCSWFNPKQHVPVDSAPLLVLLPNILFHCSKQSISASEDVHDPFEPLFCCKNVSLVEQRGLPDFFVTLTAYDGWAQTWATIARGWSATPTKR